MKLVVCIVHNRDKGRISDALIQAGFKSTIISSTGGFLREGNTTLLVGTEDDEVSTLKELLSSNCKSRQQVVTVTSPEGYGAFMPGPIEVQVGGAVAFVMEVEEFFRV